MNPERSRVISYELVMAAFADLNRMIEQQQARTTAQSGAQGQR